MGVIAEITLSPRFRLRSTEFPDTIYRETLRHLAVLAQIFNLERAVTRQFLGVIAEIILSPRCRLSSKIFHIS